MRLVMPEDADRPDLLARLSDRSATVEATVEQAVRALTERFERRTLSSLELSRETWEREAQRVAPGVRRALEHARDRIARFHEAQAQSTIGASYELDGGGVRLGLRVQPLQRVGLYVPGGTARYPSSVLMAAVPARVAGVREIVMVTPGPSPETLCAALIAGVHRVFAVGGAQAVAALAYGTESVPRVDKIVGPGNAYVAEAKRQVFGAVDIDAVAGPSEILVIADDTAQPLLVAADLLSQAEHDVEAHAILVTPSATLARAVQAEVARQLAGLPRREIAAESIRRHGVAVITRSLDEAIAFAEAYAPEHLELMIAEPRAAAARISTAGAIFLGAATPEAAGDYLAGPNHVLPTGGAARYGSPLGVYDFVKRTSLIEYTPEALAEHAGDILALAEVEGLDAHGRAVRARVKERA